MLQQCQGGKSASFAGEGTAQPLWHLFYQGKYRGLDLPYSASPRLHCYDFLCSVNFGQFHLSRNVLTSSKFENLLAKCGLKYFLIFLFISIIDSFSFSWSVFLEDH